MNIIITGTGRGIGYELTKLFAHEDKNKVFAISRNPENLKKLTIECHQISGNKNLYAFAFDLAGNGYEKSLLPEILNVFTKIDILINNAGLLISKPFNKFTEKDFDQLFDVNVKSAFLLTRMLLPYFSSNSHIVNISSMGGFQGSAKFPGLSLYSASKGALAILTECLAEELKARSIMANCLALGAVQTEMLAEAFPGYTAPLNAREMAVFIKDFAEKGHLYFNGKILPVSLSTP
jgi:NAD(P)-dependent dehydrogenase (short-subunit alcohol dehydrogenase family)